MSLTRSNKLKLWPWAYAAAGVFAGVFCWLAGHRGVNLLDQSIMFDGAWRVFQGQVPYRDFYSSFPPITFFIQSFFFWIAGVDFSAMVLAAAILNAVATVCVIWLVCRLLPGRPGMALIAGITTAVWFQAPFGTLWFEQTAFFFDLLALVLLTKAIWAEGYAAPILRMTSGLLLGLAMLSKQNAGLEFLPVAFGVTAIPYLSQLRKAVRPILQALAGVVVAFGLFAVWLWLFSSPVNFWHWYVVLTRQIGVARIKVGTTIFAMFILAPTLPFVIVALVALFAGIERSRASASLAPNRTLITWTVLGCVFFQNLFKIHTDNEPHNALPFLGLIYGLSFGLLFDVLSKRAASEVRRAPDRGRKVLYVLAGIILLGGPIYYGFRHSWHRRVQQLPYDAQFVPLTQVPGMSRVKWGEPTVVSERTGATLSRKDFEDLNAFLTEAGSNFFVFPDSTMLYGMHGRVSPQPWLYFSPGHSFFKEDLPEVDKIVIESLQRNDVRVIVLEKDSWLGNEKLLPQMPRLHSWIHKDFEKVKDFGIFEVWTSRGMHGKDRIDASID